MKAKIVPPHLGDIFFEEDIKRMSEIVETLNDLYNMSYVSGALEKNGLPILLKVQEKMYACRMDRYYHPALHRNSIIKARGYVIGFKRQRILFKEANRGDSIGIIAIVK